MPPPLGRIFSPVPQCSWQQNALRDFRIMMLRAWFWQINYYFSFVFCLPPVLARERSGFRTFLSVLVILLNTNNEFILFEIFSAAWADNMPQIVYVLFKFFLAKTNLQWMVLSVECFPVLFAFCSNMCASGVPYWIMSYRSMFWDLSVGPFDFSRSYFLRSFCFYVHRQKNINAPVFLWHQKAYDVCHCYIFSAKYSFISSDIYNSNMIS